MPIFESGKTVTTYFNIPKKEGAIKRMDYDMLYHPPDYNPKAKRDDRRQQSISWENIWEQEKDKKVPSTTYLCYGRPWLKPYDLRDRSWCTGRDSVDRWLYNRIKVENVLRWVVPLKVKPNLCDIPADEKEFQ